MIDFSKKLKGKKADKKINPIEIYDGLDRRSETGPLRKVQKRVLTEWFDTRKPEKDLIIKLHTGEGKTLIGLLILQSLINSQKGPCLYVCPSKYLVKQTCEQAKKFGIKICKVEKSIPDEFLNGERILVTHVQKVFNGKSIFGIKNKSIKVGAVILDDSHSCIDSIFDSMSIKLSSDHPVYIALFELFEEDLKSQGEGSFIDIKNGNYDTLMHIPYWSWLEKQSKVLEILSNNLDKNEVKFAWDLVKDNISNCQCFITGTKMEIFPYHCPIQFFGSFSEANHRILMSATTQNDDFFIQGLAFSKTAIMKPLTQDPNSWSGEKMLLMPSLIHEDLDRNLMVNKFAPDLKKNFGIVSLTPSFKQAKLYEELGSTVANSSNIHECVSLLKEGETEKTLVLVNRYDGIDLPDDSCRILILDSIPYGESLLERYQEQCRSDSQLIGIRKAQIIEQGIGRSVRGEKDFSIILIIGNELVRFMKSTLTNRFFSLQTQKQIEIGLEIANSTQEQITKKDSSRIESIIGVIKQFLKRDEAWKEYYRQEMDSISSLENEHKFLELLESEHNAEKNAFNGDFEKAAEITQNLIYSLADEKEKGWYLQNLARYQYSLSKNEANKIQKSAFKKNPYLLKPKEGVAYRKVNFINQNRINNIKKWVSSNDNFEDLMLLVDEICSQLVFGGNFDKFEGALQKIGLALGFVSQRPDLEYKKGPDNLWCGVNDEFFFFECKNEVNRSKEEVSKNEISQMNSHGAWFNENYNDNSKVKRVLVIPYIKISRQANSSYEISILRKGKLNTLKKNFRSFFKEFKNYNINEISDDRIQSWLITHKLDIKSLQNEYIEKPKFLR